MRLISNTCINRQQDIYKNINERYNFTKENLWSLRYVGTINVNDPIRDAIIDELKRGNF